MTPERLANLPVGTVVKLDGEEGEIIQAGNCCRIMWPVSGVTQIIYADSSQWASFIGWLEEESV